MATLIRKPRLEPLVKGIPKDFADVRDYFNKALEKNSLMWIPRKTPITDEEIRKLWIPSLETNITLVAESLGRVVAQATVFYDTESTAYEYRNQRVLGNIGLTAEPSIYKMVVKPLIKGIIEELKEQGKTAVLTTAAESPGNKIMENLKYTPEILENQERYKKAGLSGKVFQYNLP